MSGMKDKPGQPACRLTGFSDYRTSLPNLLEELDAGRILAQQERILLKPNLVNLSPPPVTLPVAALESLVCYLRDCSRAELIIAEGCGITSHTTREVFRQLGYDRLASRYDLSLLDLNEAETVVLERADCTVFPKMILPRIAMDSFLVSFPVLKAHSLAEVTLTMKNMMGLPSHRHYQQGGAWRKSAFHARMDHSIFELNRYRAPDLGIIDGRVGLAEYHLGGPECVPPVNTLVAGFDPVAVDAAGAGLLGFAWREVGHIRMADGVLGRAQSGEAALLNYR